MFAHEIAVSQHVDVIHAYPDCGEERQKQDFRDFMIWQDWRRYITEWLPILIIPES